ncbi:unnamed protein product [Acanthosepion pharaonis]|uniref:Uncharacterized protein n=1 Tax=Acanthosepion pharaonis TaxID=158019 RepID=A0A812ECW7_ACAPH|nr:unnamed protein product [Sepia pharaonis]
MINAENLASSRSVSENPQQIIANSPTSSFVNPFHSPYLSSDSLTVSGPVSPTSVYLSIYLSIYKNNTRSFSSDNFPKTFLRSKICSECCLFSTLASLVSYPFYCLFPHHSVLFLFFFSSIRLSSSASPAVLFRLTCYLLLPHLLSSSVSAAILFCLTCYPPPPHLLSSSASPAILFLLTCYPLLPHLLSSSASPAILLRLTCYPLRLHL